MRVPKDGTNQEPEELTFAVDAVGAVGAVVL